MAITWGKAIYSGIHGYRIGYERYESKLEPTPNTWGYTINYQNITSASTYISHRVAIYIQPRYSMYDPSITLTVSGAGAPAVSKVVGFDATTTTSEWSDSNIRQIHSFESRRALRYGEYFEEPYTVKVTDEYDVPGTATVSGVLTYASRLYDPPAAPTGFTASRSSDTQFGLSWTRTSPTSVSAPYQTQELQRWDNVSGAYSTIATVGNVAALTDTGTQAGRRYRWRIRARNSDAASGWVYSDYAYTTPAPPTGVTATKSGADIVVTWTAPTSALTNYRLAYEDGAGGVQYPGWTSTATSYTISAPDPALTHRYLVATQAGDTPLLSSSYVSSNTVQLLAAPKAPTGLGPAVADVSGAITLTWTHQAVDTTAQTAYVLQWRPQGSTAAWTSTGKITSTKSAHVIPSGTWTSGTTYEWQVSTWGAFTGAGSPFSASALTKAASRPTLDLTAPAAGTFPSSRVTAAWTFSTPGGGAQLGYWARLYAADGTTVLESRDVTSAASSYTFTRTVADKAPYIIGVKVKNADGLWSKESRVAISVAYAPPPTASLMLSWNGDRGAVVATISHPAPVTGQSAAVSCELWRAVGGGDYELVMAGLMPNDTVLDPLPAVGGPAVYRVVTVSALPSTTETVPVPFVEPGEGWLYLNAGPGWSRCVRVRGAVQLRRKFSVETELIQFAGDGPPVEVRGEGTTRTLDVSARLAPAVEAGASPDDLEAFILASPAPVAVRAPDGTRFYGSLSSVTSDAYNVTRAASFTLTEVSRRG